MKDGVESVESVRSKAHYIAVTGIIRKGDKYLICKRSDKEKAFPGKWCVPGGKIEQSDFINTKKDTHDHWLGIFERILKKEIKEETNLEIHNIGYVSSAAFIRANGFSTIIVSLFADYLDGSVKLNPEELIEFVWVTLEEAKGYDLIENIWEQIEIVDMKRDRN